MKRGLIFIIIAVMLLAPTAFAESPEQAMMFDIDEQLDALGRDELEEKVPREARELMRQTGTDSLSVGAMLSMSPENFFKTVMLLISERILQPTRTLASIIGVIVLCALVAALKTTSGESRVSQTFSLVCVLLVLISVMKPVLDCIVDTSNSIRDTSLFMLAYIPAFAAAFSASGAPVTGASYSVFLFFACQAALQIVSAMLVPLMGVYLALCIMGSLIPDINAGSAAKSIKTIVSWSLGFIVTAFVGVLSIQTMVAGSADTVAVRAAKFMLGSFVPVVGSALSDAYSAAQGCFKLLKTTLGAYGVVVAAFTFLPVFIQTVIWYMVASIAVVAGDIIGVKSVSDMLRSCAATLGILIAIIVSFAMLIIVSTTVVMMAGLGTAN
ncbi:MAG: stage III sporulation protein AE [Oscillospiraceae bacterium]|nr:stage III sporulation protein AE [Oscillospiraceae bacterium]